MAMDDFFLLVVFFLEVFFLAVLEVFFTHLLIPLTLGLDTTYLRPSFPFFEVPEAKCFAEYGGEGRFMNLSDDSLQEGMFDTFDTNIKYYNLNYFMFERLNTFENIFELRRNFHFGFV